MDSNSFVFDFGEVIDFGDLPSEPPAWIDPPEVATVPDRAVDIGSVEPVCDWWF